MPPISTRISQDVASRARPSHRSSTAIWDSRCWGRRCARKPASRMPDLIAQRITGPLGMRDTSVLISPERRERLIQAYGDRHQPLEPWELDAFAPAGAINSTAGDMLTYLEAQLQRRFARASACPTKPRAGDGRDMARRSRLVLQREDRNLRTQRSHLRLFQQRVFQSQGRLRRRCPGEPGVVVLRGHVAPPHPAAARGRTGDLACHGDRSPQRRPLPHAAKVHGLLGHHVPGRSVRLLLRARSTRSRRTVASTASVFARVFAGCRWRHSASSSASTACSR